MQFAQAKQTDQKLQKSFHLSSLRKIELNPTAYKLCAPAVEKYKIAIQNFNDLALKVVLHNIISDDRKAIGNNEIYKDVSLKSFDKILFRFKQKYSINYN